MRSERLAGSELEPSGASNALGAETEQPEPGLMQADTKGDLR